MTIENVSVVGMGALGILFGKYIQDKIGKESVSFVVNKNRMKKYVQQGIICNGERGSFNLIDEEIKKETDLLIIAVKATALDEAIKTAKNQVGEKTIIISLLNGITSEEIIGQAFGKEKVIYCVAQGMDAVKIDNKFTCSHMGELRIGIPKNEAYKQEKLNSVVEFFNSIDFPYTLEEDIIHRLWSKFMLNVGVNQVVMINEGNYGTVQKEGKERQMMKDAMKEVIELASYEGVKLSNEDLEGYVKLTDTLDPKGMPSMRQDGLMKRPSEVELFSGTVLKLAKKYNLEMKVNEYLYKKVKDMESGY